MKTIKQIADELDVSRQAVYKKIKQEPLSTSLQPFTVKCDNTVYITVDGIQLIKSAFSIKDLSTLSTNSVNEPVNLSTKYFESLQEQNQDLREQNHALQDALEREREHSRQQAEKLAELSQQLTELTRNSQILLKQEQDKNAFLLPESPGEGKKIKAPPFWLFWRKK